MSLPAGVMQSSLKPPCQDLLQGSNVKTAEMVSDKNGNKGRFFISGFGMYYYVSYG
jgi:hypothetical protein